MSFDDECSRLHGVQALSPFPRRGECRRWATMLRGDGWSATCRAERPLIDHVEITGVFSADIESGSGAARGLVRRVRLMTG